MDYIYAEAAMCSMWYDRWK